MSVVDGSVDGAAPAGKEGIASLSASTSWESDVIRTLLSSTRSRMTRTIVANRVGDQLLIGKRLPRRGGLIVETRPQLLETLRQRGDCRLQLLLQLLGLLLQHANVSHQLHFTSRLRR